MSMKLKVGATYYLTDQVAIAIDRQDRRDSTGRKLGYTERWVITGWLTGASAGALTTAINSLKAACVDGVDVGLYVAGTPDVATSHILTNASTVGGTRLTGPKFPVGQGAEYANQRSFTLEVEADFDEDGISGLTAFQETVQATGTGGSRFVVQTPLEGPVIAQQVARYTSMVIVQSGSAVGYSAYPTVPAPLLATGEHLDKRQVRHKGPERQANGSYRHYSVEWQYEFELPATTVPAPNTWGT